MEVAGYCDVKAKFLLVSLAQCKGATLSQATLDHMDVFEKKPVRCEVLSLH